MAAPSTAPPTRQQMQWKPIAIGIGIVLVLVPLVYWWMNRAATETLVASQPITLDGQPLHLNLLERTNSNEVPGLNADPNTQQEAAFTHFGYTLELYDSATHQSLHRIDFKAPVATIPSDPQLFVLPQGQVWLVATSPSTDDDKRGFILHFALQEHKLLQQDFELDQRYRIRSIDGHKVVLTEGSSYSGGYLDPIHGGIYLDLATGQVVDARK